MNQLLIRLRNKWVWIPALSLAVVAIVSWVTLMMLHASQEKARLQAELASAKKMLEQKQTAPAIAPVVVAPPPAVSGNAPVDIAPPLPATPAKPEDKADPAFNIVGLTPASRSEDAPKMASGDCVVKDKQSVAENLKNCIAGFNQAVGNTPAKRKAP